MQQPSIASRIVRSGASASSSAFQAAARSRALPCADGKKPRQLVGQRVVRMRALQGVKLRAQRKNVSGEERRARLVATTVLPA